MLILRPLSSLRQAGNAMTGEPDLISLLYRADWTRLGLSAEVNDLSSVLVAPGRRYRRQAGEYVTGCDGRPSRRATGRHSGD